MNRRGFLKGLLAAGAGALAGAAVLDPERLLWVPGAKTFFLPPAVSEDLKGLDYFRDRYLTPAVRHLVDEVDRAALDNYLGTPKWLADEGLRVLENQLVIAKRINRQYVDLSGLMERAPGDVVRMKVPKVWVPV